MTFVERKIMGSPISPLKAMKAENQQTGRRESLSDEKGGSDDEDSVPDLVDGSDSSDDDSSDDEEEVE